MAKSKRPVFNTNSRMKHYAVIFDDTIQQNRVGFYSFKVADRISQTDHEMYTITKGMEYRLDLISVKFFGTAAYDWLIAEYNNIEDPIRDIVAGKKIKIPSRASVGTV